MRSYFKIGSPNGKSSKGMSRPHKCPDCKKSYAMLWAYENHVKHCVNGR